MRKYLWLVFRLGPYILWNYFWIFRYSRHPERYTAEQKFNRVKKFINHCNKAFRIDYYISGEENLPTGDVAFLTPNHISNYDPIMLIVILNRPFACVAKKEILKFPFVGRLQKIMGGVFIDRQDLRQELKIMRTVKESLINNENDWVIYPEGTRNKDIEHVDVSSFKHGAYKMAMEAKRDIIPVAAYGTQRVLSTKSHLKRYPVHLSFLTPIKPSEYENLKSADVCDMVEQIVRKEYLRIKALNEELAKKH